MGKYSLILVASLVLFSGCGGGGSESKPSSLANSSVNNNSDVERKLREDFGFAGASNITKMDTNIVAFTYFKDGNKHFAIFDLQQGKKLSEQKDFTGDVVSSSTHNTVTFQNNTKVAVDTTDYTKKPVIVTQPTYTQQKSPQQYIREYYENDGSDWTIMESFTYSSDNHSDAAVVVSNAHAWDFYIYDIPSSGNPYVDYTITPPSSQDEWTNIYNVQRIGGGKITFTGVSKGAGRKNYTYYYLDHYYENTSDSMNHNDTRSPQEIITQKVEADQLHSVEYFVYTPQRGGAAVVISTPGGRGLYFYDLDDENYNTRYEIYGSDDDDVFTNVSMLGGSLLEYTYYNKYQPSSPMTVRYDFIDQHIVSNSSSDNNDNSGSKTGTVKAGDNKYISINDTVYLEAYDIRGLASGLSYRWTDSNGNILSTSQGFTYRGTSTGQHRLHLTVTDRNGNYATDYVEVNITGTGSSSSSSSLVEQFKNDINNFKWSYVSHDVSPQGHGAIVLAYSDDGGYHIYLYGISGDGTVNREALLVDENSYISNLQMLSGGRFSYQVRGRTITKSYL